MWLTCEAHVKPIRRTMPYKVKYVHFRYIQNTFFYLGRFLKKLADDRCTWITKGSIYHVKHMSIQPFYHGLTWNWAFYGSTYMFDICAYCVFTLYGSKTPYGQLVAWLSHLTIWSNGHSSSYFGLIILTDPVTHTNQLKWPPNDACLYHILCRTCVDHEA